MKQIDPSIYQVGAGENIIVEIEATGVGNFATLAVDGKLIPSTPGSNPLSFESFPITVGAGLAQFGRVSCHFPDDAAPDATFRIFLTGDQGGGRFQGDEIRKTDLGWDSGLDFRR